MATSATIFDQNIERWDNEQSQPWQKLKYKLVHAHLMKHMGGGQWHILDAGGGNGLDSIPFAEEGHRVKIVDFSREMLADISPMCARCPASFLIRNLIWCCVTMSFNMWKTCPAF